MKILVLNSGSSSLKFSLFAMEEEQVLASGLVERIGEATGKIEYDYVKNGEKLEHEEERPVPDHGAGLNRVMELLATGETAVIASTDEIDAVGHRVVHGGEQFTAPVLVDASVEAAIEATIPLAPLHNPANLTGIQVAGKLMPEARQVAVFDTAFHQTMPEYAYRYAFPEKYYKEYGVRRYGFHGTSHKYVSAEVAKLLGKAPAETTLISAHLGNGASMAAVKNGQCVDTSLGMTPLPGLIMGTRTGDFDPAILFYLADRAGMSLKELDTLVNKESGMKGLTGSNDLRDIHAKADSGDAAAKLALQMYAFRIKKYIGSYVASLGPVDALVFTAGVGENDDIVRAMAVTGLEHLGFTLDAEANAGRKKTATKISAADSAVAIFVIPTNEELEIARQTKDLVA